jgi:hypothetical protein
MDTPVPEKKKPEKDSSRMDTPAPQPNKKPGSDTPARKKGKETFANRYSRIAEMYTAEDTDEVPGHSPGDVMITQIMTLGSGATPTAIISLAGMKHDTPRQIRVASRRLSTIVHPEKNLDNMDAQHALNLVYRARDALLKARSDSRAREGQHKATNPTQSDIRAQSPQTDTAVAHEGAAESEPDGPRAESPQTDPSVAHEDAAESEPDDGIRAEPPQTDTVVAQRTQQNQRVMAAEQNRRKLIQL